MRVLRATYRQNLPTWSVKMQKFLSANLPRLVRMFADYIILISAFLFAQYLRHLAPVFYADGATEARLSVTLFDNLELIKLFLLAAFALLIFYLHGFYTSGRYYQSKFKILLIFQAVSVFFLLLSAFLVLFPGSVALSRSVLVTAYILSFAAFACSRLWSAIWRRVIALELAPTGHPSPFPNARSSERRVLVIGGAGYIGSALVPLLLERGDRVRVLDLMLYGEEPLRPVLHHPRLEIARADFRHVDALVRHMRDVDVVVHLGGLVGDPACAHDEQLTLDINLAATRTIAEVARGAGVKLLIFASTCSVYGASDEVLDERSALNPVSLYARSKIASEHMLRRMASSEFRIIIPRFATIHGLSGRTRFDLVVNLLAAKAIMDGKITVFGADQWRPFVHVRDAARAVDHLAAIEAIGENPLIINVGENSQNYTLGDIGRKIKYKVPSAELIIGPAEGDRRNYRVDFNKLARFGFRILYTVDYGIDEVIAAVRSGHVKDYRDPQYSNIGFLRSGGDQMLARSNPRWMEEVLQEALQLPSAAIRS